MAVVWKGIKPSKLKQDAFRLEALNEMRKVGRKMRQDFDKTTATWNHTVKFEILVSLKGSPTLAVDTNDEIYRYVDQGTRPHIIRPKNASVLVFKGGSVAKTTPRVIGSGGGGSFGATVFAKEVRHPGTTARLFSKTIADKWKKPFQKAMEQALNTAAKKSGHGI